MPTGMSKESSESAQHLSLQVDQDGSKEIEYEEFIYAFRISKSMQLHPDEQDTVDAWAALGGNVRHVMRGFGRGVYEKIFYRYLVRVFYRYSHNMIIVHQCVDID